MNDGAIVLMATKKMVFAIGALLYNLKKINLKVCRTIVIYHDGIDDGDLLKLKAVDDRCVFVKYTVDDFRDEHKNIDADSKKLSEFLRRYSHLSVVKYKSLEYLRDHNSVIFLDLDVVIKRDFSDAFNVRGMGWRDSYSLARKILPFTSEDSDFVGVSDKNTTPNAGFVAISNKVPFEEMIADSKYFVSKYAGKITLIDEALFGWLAFKHSVDVVNYGANYNMQPERDTDEAKIVHTIGAKKIWNDKLLSYLHPDWMSYHDEWLKFSGDSNNLNISGGDLVKDRAAIFNSIRNFEKIDAFFRGCDLIVPEWMRLHVSYKSESVFLYLREYGESVYFELKMTSDKSCSIHFWVKSKLHCQSVSFKDAVSGVVNFSGIFSQKADNNFVVLEAKHLPLDQVTIVFEAIKRTIVPLLKDCNAN